MNTHKMLKIRITASKIIYGYLGAKSVNLINERDYHIVIRYIFILENLKYKILRSMRCANETAYQYLQTLYGMR